jgi:hypothetical protein
MRYTPGPHNQYQPYRAGIWAIYRLIKRFLFPHVSAAWIKENSSSISYKLNKWTSR